MTSHPQAPAPDRVRWGVNLPIAGLTHRAHRDLVPLLPDLGYDDVWTGEGGGDDAITPLAAASAWQPRLRLGTGIVPVYTRGPGVLAQTAVSLARGAEGGVLFGIGASVPAHVTALNGVEYDRPYARVRDTLRFLTKAVRGGVVSQEYETFAVRGFQLPVGPEPAPKIVLGALRPGMLRLAFNEGDGAVTNILTAANLPTVLAALPTRRPGQELVVKLFVCPTTDARYARAAGRRFLAWILNRDVYRKFHEWLGNGEALARCHALWEQGDPHGAAQALPDALVDELWLHGEVEHIRERVRRFLLPGVSTVLLYVAPVPGVGDRAEAVADLLTGLRG